MQKQQAFSALGSAFKAPEIIGCGTHDDGRFYFDMEFIVGLDGHRYLEKCAPAELRQFSTKLAEHLTSLRGLPCIGHPSAYQSLFEACVFKLIEIHHRHVGLSDDLAGRILNGLQAVKDLGITEQSFCHGDFTLENIVVNARGDLHFVDFLDSSFEHPVQDLIKLSQDTLGSWFRFRGRRISAAIISHLDEAFAVAAQSICPAYEDVRSVLQAWNFCRILPYISDASQKTFILNKIHTFAHALS